MVEPLLLRNNGVTGFKPVSRYDDSICTRITNKYIPFTLFVPRDE
jgi:hypothetical protein